MDHRESGRGKAGPATNVQLAGGIRPEARVGARLLHSRIRRVWGDRRRGPRRPLRVAERNAYEGIHADGWAQERLGIRPSGPTAAEIRASVENSERAPKMFPKGVYRYRNHEEANAQMEQWLADGMVKRKLELDGLRIPTNPARD